MKTNFKNFGCSKEKNLHNCIDCKHVKLDHVRRVFSCDCVRPASFEAYKITNDIKRVLALSLSKGELQPFMMDCLYDFIVDCKHTGFPHCSTCNDLADYCKLKGIKQIVKIPEKRPSVDKIYNLPADLKDAFISALKTGYLSYRAADVVMNYLEKFQYSGWVDCSQCAELDEYLDMIEGDQMVEQNNPLKIGSIVISVPACG